MSPRRVLRTILISVLVLINSVVLATEYHVAKDGSDTNNGSVLKPLKTISAADIRKYLDKAKVFIEVMDNIVSQDEGIFRTT